MNFGKSRLKSKSIWLGVLTALISLLGLIAGQEWIQQYPEIVSYIGLAVGILTVIVRHYTEEPLKPLSG